MDAIERQDWDALRWMLHPYIHWSDHGEKMRGRSKVMAHLTAHPVAIAPASYELRDGQIYRWTVDGDFGRSA